MLIKFSMCLIFEFYSWCFQVWLNIITVSFDWSGFISITINFIFDIIVVMEISCSYWFVIIFFFPKKVLNISSYSALEYSNYFVFWLFFILGFLCFSGPSYRLLTFAGLLEILVLFFLKKTHNFVFKTSCCFL